MSLTQNLKSVLGEFSDALAEISEIQARDLVDLILSAERLFLVGRGRSGLQVRGFAMRLMQMGFQVHVADDVTTPSIQKGDILIIGSGSGATASLLGYAQKAKSQGAKLAMITITPASPIGDMADLTLILPGRTPKTADPSTPKSVLPLGSSFELLMALVFEALILDLMDATNTSEDSMFARHANLE